MREHASRPGDEQGVAKGGKFVVAGDQTVTRRKGELHAVGKTDDHDERRHHVQKNVQAEVEPAERAQRQQNGGERRRGGDDHERHAAEEQDGNQAAGDKSKRVIDQPIALDRVAGLELHHRDAGQLAVQAGARQMLVDGFADVADHAGKLIPGRRRVEREHDQGELAVLRQQFAANDFVRHHPLNEVLVFRAGPARDWGRGEAGICPFSGGCRAENNEMTPRVPSISCRSITRSRSFSSDGPIEQRWAFNHDQNVEFGGRENFA